MVKNKLKSIGAIAALSSALLFNNCVANEQDFAAGVAVGALVGSVMGAYDSPRYYDKPYYYHVADIIMVEIIVMDITFTMGKD